MPDSGDLFIRISGQVSSLTLGAAQCVALHASHDPGLHPAVLDCILRSVKRHHGEAGLEVPFNSVALLALHQLDPTAPGFRETAEPHMSKIRGTPYLLDDAKAQAFFVGLPDECWGDPLSA